MVNTTWRNEIITGASLSGTSGATNRTYGLKYSDAQIGGMNVVVQGTILQDGTTFTFASNTITFIGAVWDGQAITINYITTGGTDPSQTNYATTLQLVAVLGVKKDIPSWAAGATPVNETVGTGDDSETIFYLDRRNVIRGTNTLYYGATATTTTELTETTHYVIDLDNGKITLTTAGVTLVSTSNIYAKYSYSSLDLPDSYYATVIKRASTRVDKITNNIFTDGTTTNPSYPSKTEVQSSNGKYNLSYYSQEYPLIDIASTLNGAVAAIDTTVALNAGDGDNYPTTGTIIVNNEIITYTSISTDTLSGCTRGVADSTAAAHASGDAVHSTVVEVSGTSQGTNPTWTALKHGTQVNVDAEKGKVFIYQDSIFSNVDLTNVVMSQQDVDNRFRLRYLYGWTTIPFDITRLAILYAKQMLISDVIGRSLIAGRDEFNPTLTDIDKQEMESIIANYKSLKVSNT